MDVTAKRALVEAAIGRVHPLDRDVAGGSGHLSSSSLGEFVTGGEAADGSFPFAAEVGRVSEFGGSIHWFRGTIVPGGASRVESLEPVTHGDEGPDSMEVRRRRRELGLPVLGRDRDAYVRRALGVHVEPHRVRTSPERLEGHLALFEFAALAWEPKMPGAALWYVGTVSVDLETDRPMVEFREHPKSRELVRHENFNARDLARAEESIWRELGYGRNA
jgi:hypothetical protein